MGVLSWIADKIGTKTPTPAPAQRSSGYFAAEYSRITASLVSEARHINDIIRWQGYTLLSRSRQLADNNPHAAKFLQMVVNNICGPNPFQLQGRVRTVKGNKPDEYANRTIEAAWQKWSRPGICDFHGRLSLSDIYRLAIRTAARDGEAIIRIHEGRTAGPFGFRLQLVDTDRLDFDFNKELPGGNMIYAGVEVDKEGRIVAYHLLKRRPSQWQYRTVAEYERVPAEQIIHLFVPLSAEQIRGVPWMYASMVTVHQLGAFEEAAVIAARVGAAKMGFFERDPLAPPSEWSGETDSTGAKITDAEPGTFEELPAGLKFSSWDPNYPSDQVGPFMKSCLRSIATGWGVSYHTLGNDLEAVNFSSARAGVLEEREYWMLLQNWFVEHCCTVIYERWLSMATLTGALQLTGPLDKYTAVYFQPRRWQWVDPFKDVQANIEAIKWGLKSRTSIVAEQGQDLEDVFDQLAAEESMAEAKGVEITPQDEKPQGGADNAQDDQASQ